MHFSEQTKKEENNDDQSANKTSKKKTISLKALKSLLTMKNK